jgi:hypothetical protein
VFIVDLLVTLILPSCISGNLLNAVEAIRPDGFFFSSPIWTQEILGKTNRTEKDSSNSYVAACVFVDVKFLPLRCLATIRGLLPSCCLETIGRFLPIRCLATVWDTNIDTLMVGICDVRH